MFSFVQLALHKIVILIHVTDWDLESCRGCSPIRLRRGRHRGMEIDTELTSVARKLRRSCRHRRARFCCHNISAVKNVKVWLGSDPWLKEGILGPEGWLWSFLFLLRKVKRTSVLVLRWSSTLSLVRLANANIHIADVFYATLIGADLWEWNWLVLVFFFARWYIELSWEDNRQFKAHILLLLVHQVHRHKEHFFAENAYSRRICQVPDFCTNGLFELSL